MRTLSTFCFVTGLLGLSTQALGQQPPPAEEVTITVSSEAIPVQTAAASVTIIGAEEIASSGVRTVGDLLRRVPGVNVVRSGGAGGFTSISLRGAEASFTLVMIDGIPLNDISNQQGGDYDLSGLSLDNVERIEIVRGPLSSLYGSEAAGGVINIVSRRGDGPLGGTARLAFGNFSSKEVAASAGGSRGAFDFSLASSYSDIDEQTEGDTLTLGTVSGNGMVAVGANKFLRFSARYSNTSATAFPENGGGPEYSILRETRSIDATEVLLASSFEHQVMDEWLYSVRLDYFSRDQELFTPFILDAIPPTERSQPSIEGTSDFHRLRLGLQNNWTLPGNWSAGGLFQFRHEDGNSDQILAGVLPSEFDLSRNTAAAAGELLYRDGRLTASVGLRVDGSQGFGTEVSPRAGINILVSSWGLRIKSSIGEGFKLPSFFALAEPNVGNPRLRPEKSRGFDLGIEFNRNMFSGSLMYFYSRFEDLIDFSPEQFLLVNRSRVVSQGAEWELRFQASESLELSGHARYMNLENVGSSEPLRDRPRWRGGLAVNWKATPKTLIRIDNLWVGPRYDFQLPLPEQNVVDGYSTASLLARHQLTPSLEFFFRAENLFDRSYHEFIGFPSPGISWRVGMQFRYGM